MATLFEQQGVQYEMQGDYRLTCVTLQDENDYEIGVWGLRYNSDKLKKALYIGRFKG